MNAIYRILTSTHGADRHEAAERFARKWQDSAVASQPFPHDIDPLELTEQTATLFAEKIDADSDILTAIALMPLAQYKIADSSEIEAEWGADASTLVESMLECKRFSNLSAAVDQDNYRGLLLGLARDIRVIIVMIVENLALMRMINHHPDEQWVRSVAFEAGCLYSQLAHRLGLYAVKGELEDLAFKYSNRDVYTSIARRLNETKKERDAYIEAFIKPVKHKLEKEGLKFDIKGRTKSISSIWAKIQKQKVDMSHIYDLFAIRVIIDTPLENEKRDCWLAYSVLADMYRANPARMRDWISVPKSNGYESLHATVMGPGDRWVEVQFRTRRMDLVAEKGLAAHWRYKGGHADGSDMWMNNIRDILETAEEGPMQLMKNMRMDPFSKEVFAFTPKGDLLRLPAGATVLDFAFTIHSNVGSHCVGAVVNSRHRKINYKVRNGDTIEIVTSPSQQPRRDWLSIVTTSKARTKIRQTLNEARMKRAELGKELYTRRVANRKMKVDEAILTRLLKKHGYKFANDFFVDLADEKIDLQRFLTELADAHSQATETKAAHDSAEAFRLMPTAEKESAKKNSSPIVIDGGSIAGMSYRFARCCSPVHGDELFGFVSADGVVKIHRADCPNALSVKSRYPYRVIDVRWNDEWAGSSQLSATIRIVGTDDIGIVTNISSIINKDPGALLRNISIDAHDGMFQGYLTVGVTGGENLGKLIRKLLTVKGVKTVTRV